MTSSGPLSSFDPNAARQQAFERLRRSASFRFAAVLICGVGLAAAGTTILRLNRGARDEARPLAASRVAARPAPEQVSVAPPPPLASKPPVSTSSGAVPSTDVAGATATNGPPAAVPETATVESPSPPPQAGAAQMVAAPHPEPTPAGETSAVTAGAIAPVEQSAPPAPTAPIAPAAPPESARPTTSASTVPNQPSPAPAAAPRTRQLVRQAPRTTASLGPARDERLTRRIARSPTPERRETPSQFRLESAPSGSAGNVRAYRFVGTGGRPDASGATILTVRVP